MATELEMNGRDGHKMKTSWWMQRLVSSDDKRACFGPQALTSERRHCEVLLFHVPNADTRPHTPARQCKTTAEAAPSDRRGQLLPLPWHSSRYDCRASPWADRCLLIKDYNRWLCWPPCELRRAVRNVSAHVSTHYIDSIVCRRRRAQRFMEACSASHS